MAVLDDGSRNQHPIERTISWSLVISRVIEMVELEIDHARKRARLGSSFKDIVPMLRQVCKVADKRTRTHSLTHRDEWTSAMSGVGLTLHTMPREWM